MLNKSFSRHRGFEQALTKLDYRLFTIPQDAKIAECQIAHKSLYDFAPQTKAVSAFETLTDALMET
jgi:nitrogenase subunit NifH